MTFGILKPSVGGIDDCRGYCCLAECSPKKKTIKRSGVSWTTSQYPDEGIPIEPCPCLINRGLKSAQIDVR